MGGIGILRGIRVVGMALGVAGATVGCADEADPGPDPGADPGADRGMDGGTDGSVDALPEVAGKTCAAGCGAMTTVAAGSFTMGCNAAVSADCEADEKPAHAVDLPAFEVDLHEATIALWSRCMGDGMCTAPNNSSPGCNMGIEGHGQHPVNCITHAQAAAFCRWAGKRLCTEAEWEKAALGTDGRRHPWGSDPASCTVAVLDEGGDGCGTMATFPVGSRPAGASPCGARDMAGNVWEWVADGYHPTYAGAPADGSARPAGPDGIWAARGGAYGDPAAELRGTNRQAFGAALDGYYLGTRCCRTP